VSARLVTVLTSVVISGFVAGSTGVFGTVPFSRVVVVFALASLDAFVNVDEIAADFWPVLPLTSGYSPR